MDTQTSDRLNCPQCGMMDKVQKVSSVVTGEVSSGAYDGPSTTGTARTTLAGGSQTLRSEILALPAKPKAAGISAGTIIATIVLAGPGACCALIGLNLAGEGSGDEVGWLLVGFVLIGIAIAIYVLADNRAKERAAKAAAQLPAWEKARERWERLFYCQRCDGVFDPDKRIFVPTGQVREYLYR